MKKSGDVNDTKSAIDDLSLGEFILPDEFLQPKERFISATRALYYCEL